MSEAPRPIVLVSASHRPDEVKWSFRALEAGALTVLGKPLGPGDPQHEAQARTLVQTVKALAGVKLVRRRGQRLERVEQAPRAVASVGGGRVDVVAIAASTGGPAALSRILRDLPKDFPVPVLVVQHIAKGFDKGLVDWLNGVSPLEVSLASHGRPLRRGEVLVAPHDRHLGVSLRSTAELDDSAPIGGHRPSATYLFRSVSAAYGAHALGVILTGIGTDGQPGLSDMKKAGGTVFAQDQESSVVYGMPKAAVESGLADQVLPVAEVAGALLVAVGAARR